MESKLPEVRLTENKRDKKFTVAVKGTLRFEAHYETDAKYEEMKKLAKSVAFDAALEEGEVHITHYLISYNIK